MKITIKKNRAGGFNVYALGQFGEHLNYDEMLGLISSLTMPEHRPCMGYLRTKEERKAWEERFKKPKPKETKQPLLLDRDHKSQGSFNQLREHLLDHGSRVGLLCPNDKSYLGWSQDHQQFKCRRCEHKTNFPLGFIIELRRKHNLPTPLNMKSGFTRLVKTEERIKQLAKLKAPLLVTEWLDGETLVSSLFVECLNHATLSRLLRNKSIFEFNS